MWYVIQVMTGMEENIKCQCEKLIDSKILERCFIPYYEEKKKYQGSWHTETKVLFPGYVFLVSDRIIGLQEALHRVSGLTKLIGVGDEIIALSNQEVALLRRLGLRWRCRLGVRLWEKVGVIGLAGGKNGGGYSFLSCFQ